MTAAELQEAVNKWLDIYRHYRPREALDYMTPAEVKAHIKSKGGRVETHFIPAHSSRLE
jgi:hypothetical protein